MNHLLLTLFVSTQLFASGFIGGGGSALTTKGDLLGHDGASQDALAVGTNNQCLVADSTADLGIKWGSCSSGSSPLTTKGDIFTYAGADERLPVGTNGQCLTAASGESTGLLWAACEATISATDNAVARFNGTTGVLQDSSVTISDTGQLLINGGTDGAPGIAFSTDNDGSGTGIYRSTTNRLSIATNGVQNTSFDETEGVRVFVGQLKVPNGTAAAPGLTFFGDQDSGVYRSGANSVDIAANGTRIVSVSDAGVTLRAGTLAGVVEDICGHIETPENKTYWLKINAPYPFTINSITTDVDSGTASGQLAIDGTPVTGCETADISISTTEVEDSCTAANAVSVGNDLTLAISSNSSADDLRFCVKITRD